MDLWNVDVLAHRMTTIFTSLPSDIQWVTMGVGTLLVLSWLYLLFAVRSMKRRTAQIVSEVREAIDRIGGPAMEQQAELIRRIGWAVSYLERIEQTLESPSASNMRVASITAQNLVVRPSKEDGWSGGNGR